MRQDFKNINNSGVVVAKSETQSEILGAVSND